MNFKKTKRLGIFGGTFDPIHHAHLNIAFQAFKHLKLNQVLFIPCGIPTHKENAHAKKNQRLKMLRLALKNNPFFKICDFELKKKTPSFTIETLEYLRLFYSIRETEFFWIIGADAFNQIKTWHRWNDLFNLSNFALFPRPEFSLNNLELEKEKMEKIIYIPITPQTMSSTQIRENIKNGKIANLEINKQVEKYIFGNEIYF